VFDDFDPVPIGAASLAQVHKAKLKTGEKVAIKL
jgi:ubiquinone biosynthesis protein